MFESELIHAFEANLPRDVGDNLEFISSFLRRLPDIPRTPEQQRAFRESLRTAFVEFLNSRGVLFDERMSDFFSDICDRVAHFEENGSLSFSGGSDTDTEDSEVPCTGMVLRPPEALTPLGVLLDMCTDILELSTGRAASCPDHPLGAFYVYMDLVKENEPSVFERLLPSFKLIDRIIMDMGDCNLTQALDECPAMVTQLIKRSRACLERAKQACANDGDALEVVNETLRLISLFVLFVATCTDEEDDDEDSEATTHAEEPSYYYVVEEYWPEEQYTHTVASFSAREECFTFYQKYARLMGPNRMEGDMCRYAYMREYQA